MDLQPHYHQNQQQLYSNEDRTEEEENEERLSSNNNSNKKRRSKVTYINVAELENQIDYELAEITARNTNLTARKRDEECEKEYDQFIDRLKKVQERKLARERKRTLSRMYRWIDDSFSFYNKIWSEIAYCVFDNIQLLGLIWTLPLKLPYWFYNVTRFTLYFNLDFISSKQTIRNALYYLQNGGDQFPWYLTFWWLYMLLIILWKIMPLFYKFKYNNILERMFYTMIYMLYLPYVFQTTVYGTCGAVSYGEFNCRFYCKYGRYYCLARSIPFIVLTLVVIIAVPVLFWWEASKLIIYRNSKKHESMLRSVETEKALKLTNNFSTHRYHLINSFKKNGIYYMMNVRFIQKLAIIATLCAVPSIKNGHVDDRYHWIIGMITCFVIAIPLVIELLLRPYRVLSPVAINQILGWINVGNAFFGWMKASKVRNAFLVDSNLMVILFCLNGAAYLSALVLSLFWRFVQKIKWPINNEVIYELQSEYYLYIDAIRNGYLLYEHAQTTHPMFVRCDLIARQKSLLQQYYSEAIIEKNPLEDTLEDVLMKLEEEYFINEPYTILPHKPLQRVLGQLKADMDIRNSRMLLISFDKRIILMKILAYSAFCDLLTNIQRKKQSEANKSASKIFAPRSPVKSVNLIQFDEPVEQQNNDEVLVASPKQSQNVVIESNIDEFLNPKSPVIIVSNENNPIIVVQESDEKTSENQNESEAVILESSPSPQTDSIQNIIMYEESESERQLQAPQSMDVDISKIGDIELLEYHKQLKDWLKMFEQKFQSKFNKKPNKRVIEKMPQVLSVYNKYKLVAEEMKRRKSS